MRKIIINFHGVGCCPRDYEPGEEPYWLTRDRFHTIMKLIPSSSHVYITIDDGNQSDYSEVLPQLLAHERKATFFILAGRVNQQGYLESREIQALHSAGMAIGSHGCDHVDWCSLSKERLREEIVDSKRILENLVGKEITDVSIPFGSYNRRVLRKLREAGYQRIYTSDRGYAKTERLLLPRNTIKVSDENQAIEKIFKEGWRLPQRLLLTTKQFIKRSL